ncbi:MAG: hypothetical protein RI947_1506 [Candidatus Parcubacteria bacterium]|jgi:hypothetical protein
MNSDILSFQKSADDFVGAFRAIPAQALAYKPQGDDYTVGGLIVHVLDVMKKYGSVLDSIVNSSKKEPVRSDHSISKQEEQWIKEGIGEEERVTFLKEVESLQKSLMERLGDLSEEQYGTKTPVIYENADEPYPTSPADLLGWLKDHYIEHVVQIEKIVKEWKKT